MKTGDESAFDRGRRAAWIRQLRDAIRNLGIENNEAADAARILERVGAVRELREVCGEFGDNDWADGLDLADVVEKHLGRHLMETRR